MSRAARTPSLRPPRRAIAKTRSLQEFHSPKLESPPDRTSVHRGAVEQRTDRPVVQLPVSQELIAALAFDLWQKRGGTSEQNWLEAEQRLRTQAIL